MAITYKIHPAIGIARVGDSPDEFFIGPERPHEYPDPPGGFKDAQCRVKRQAARFRIFAYDDVANTVEEIDDSKAEITWTVHLVNKKAADPGRGNSEPAADLSIDPGPRSLNGPNQASHFDNGKITFLNTATSLPVTTTVPLGEIRSDLNNHLLVLGGHGKSASPTGAGIGSFWGNAKWYDDISDGPVAASIKLRSDGSTPPVVGAWVIVAPPKFAPQLDSVTTLYDRVTDALITGAKLPKPTTTSYTQDIYPILQRARGIRWVITIPGGAMTWPDPVVDDATRQTIFASLRNPAGGGDDMPILSGTDSTLTQTQYDHMGRWKDGMYTSDWIGPPLPPPDITPDGLDRAALEACVGGAFFPGIEGGGMPGSTRPLVNPGNYLEPYRLNPAVVQPGDVSAVMALPWQADFKACGSNWWPVPRPDQVIPEGGSSYQNWDATVPDMAAMVNLWHTLGFVVSQGDKQVLVGQCDIPSVTLLTPHLNFLNVPQGPAGIKGKRLLAISFEVISPVASVTLEYSPGKAPSHPQLAAMNNSVSVGPTGVGAPVAMARLWIEYTTNGAGAIPRQTVTVTHAATGRIWDVAIDGNTVARKTAAAALVLDRSGSMSELTGAGASKHDALQAAGNIFIDLMFQDDGVGVVRFNQAAQVLQNVLKLGDGSGGDINRASAKTAISGTGLDPNGTTSIGDGIVKGRGILNGAADPYDVKSLVVLTDGMENTPPYIADVASSINEQTYAIGLGKPEDISVPALQTISGNHGGYMLVTGNIGPEQKFLLQKYFLQILAGIKNAEVVLDPDGELTPGIVQRIPFQLTESDSGVEVILLTPYPGIVDFRLQTPTGQILEPWRALAEPTMHFGLSENLSFYRLSLPAQLQPGRFDQGGTWQVLLQIGRPRLERYEGNEFGIDFSILRPAGAEAAGGQRAMLASVAQGPARDNPTVPFSVVVHSYSSLSMKSSGQQSRYEPGAAVRMGAVLPDFGRPASVWANVRRPDGVDVAVVLGSLGGGVFEGGFDTGPAGVYQVRLRALGQSAKGFGYTRERTFTVPVWHGGDRDAINQPGGDQDGGGQCGHGCGCPCLARLWHGLHSFFCKLFKKSAGNTCQPNP